MKMGQRLAKLRVRREHLKEIIEGPNQELDRLIVAVRAHRGKMPIDLIVEYRLQDDPAVVARIERLIKFPFKRLPQLPLKVW